MLKLNGNKEDFESRLLSKIKEANKKPAFADAEEIQKNLQYKLKRRTLELILSISKSSIHFAVPNFPSDYENYSKKKKKKTFDISSVLSFEYDFVDFAEEFFGKKEEVEFENPSIIFFIPSNSKYIEEMEMSIGSKINGGFLFVVKKTKTDWQISVLGYSVDEEMECTGEIAIFESDYMKIKYENATDFVDNSSMLYRKSIFDVFTNSIYIALNEDEELYLSDKGVFVPSTFFSNKIKDIPLSRQEERIKSQKRLITSMEILYSNSNKF